MRPLRSEIVVLIVLLAAAAASADVLTVDGSGGAMYMTIRAAVDAAEEGDTVRVAEGVYSGSDNRLIDPDGTNIVIESDGGPDAVTIDCTDAGMAFRFQSSEDTTTVVRGFTVVNGYGPTNPGAALITFSDPIFENCVFRDCETGFDGGALRFVNSESVVRDCTFRRCVADEYGGAIFASGSDLSIRRCVFDENEALTLGGGILCTAGTQTISGCTFAENTASTLCSRLDGNTMLISNSVLATCVDGQALSLEGGGQATTTRCLVFGNAGGDSLCGDYYDNIFYDPLFCDTSSDDYSHCADSKCLAPNNPWGERVGALGEGCPACETPVERASWGHLKALFIR
jgi:predicted outer membrane repeat protein